MPTSQEIIGQIQNANATGWKEIESLARQLDINQDELAKKFTQIHDRDYLAEIGEPERTFHASAILHSELMNGAFARAEEFEIHVLSVTAPNVRKIQGAQKRTCNLYGIGTKVTKDGQAHPVGFVEATFWDDDVERAADAQPGKTYRTWFSVSRTGGDSGFKNNTWRLNSTKRTTFGDSAIIKDAQPINAAEAIQRFFPTVPLAEADKYVSKNYEWRLVRGRVVFAQTGVGKKSGRAYGRMTIYDKSRTSEEWKDAGSGFSVMIDPTQAQYGMGSELLILGQITKSEQYGLGMNGRVVVPLFRVPPPVAKAAEASAPAETDEPKDVEVDDFDAFE